MNMRRERERERERRKREIEREETGWTDNQTDGHTDNKRGLN